MKNKFTFKTEKPTGRYSGFSNSTHYIKLKKHEVGEILKPNVGNGQHTDYKIRLSVLKKDINENEIPNCIWKNIFLKKPFNSLEEAKTFLNDNIDLICERYDLYCSDTNEKFDFKTESFIIINTI